MAVPAHEAAGWLTGKPQYGSEPNWPVCKGRCLDGLCALKHGTPACCYVHREADNDFEQQYGADDGADNRYHTEDQDDAYDTGRDYDYYRVRPYADASEAAAASGGGHNGRKEWFCWGK